MKKISLLSVQVTFVSVSVCMVECFFPKTPSLPVFFLCEKSGESCVRPWCKLAGVGNSLLSPSIQKAYKKSDDKIDCIYTSISIHV